MPAEEALRHWIVYGTGAVTTQALRLAAQAGLPTIVAGRTESLVRELSEKISLPWRTGALALCAEPFASAAGIRLEILA